MSDHRLKSSRIGKASAAAMRRIGSAIDWLSAKGQNHQHDLGVVDEIFAIFAGITLFVSNTKWLQAQPEIIYTIFVSVSLTVVAIVLTINQHRFWPRVVCNALSLLLAFGSVDAIMYASRHDLAPQIDGLNALPIGVMAWIGIREFAVFLMNLLPDFNAETTPDPVEAPDA